MKNLRLVGCVVLFMTSCSSTVDLSVKADKIKIPPGNTVLLTFYPNGSKTIEVTPVPFWEQITSGMFKGLTNLLKPSVKP